MSHLNFKISVYSRFNCLKIQTKILVKELFCPINIRSYAEPLLYLHFWCTKPLIVFFLSESLINSQNDATMSITWDKRKKLNFHSNILISLNIISIFYSMSQVIEVLGSLLRIYLMKLSSHYAAIYYFTNLNFKRPKMNRWLSA